MNKAFLILAIVFCIVSCTSDRKEKQEQREPPVAQEKKELDSLPWNTVYNEQTQKLELQHNDVSTEGLDVAAVIRAINKKYPNIKLEAVASSNDTLITRIDDAMYLTQQMGTAGAETYFAEVTYALTELPGIKAVRFDFEEGDHAMPGSYSRASFKDFR